MTLSQFLHVVLFRVKFCLMISIRLGCGHVCTKNLLGDGSCDGRSCIKFKCRPGPREYQCHVTNLYAPDQK